MAAKKKHKLVIVGGGFAGVKTALELASQKDVEITLISDRNYFVYYPALYNVATGRSQKQAVVLLQQIFEHIPQVSIVIDEIVSVQPASHILTATSGKSYTYETCVMALGVVTSYFGLEGLEQYSYSIKSIEGLRRFKAHLHQEVTQKGYYSKNYIVVGAGPTGVELSAALVTYLHKVGEQHNVDTSGITVSLVEAAPRVLPRMSETASHLVAQRLEKLGVRLMVNQKVVSQDDDSIIINGEDIPTTTVIWTSGVANHPFFANNSHHFELAKNGRVVVDETMRAAEDIYVIGDNAVTSIGLAQIALHDAQYIAKVVTARARHRKIPLYKTVSPPVVIPVGIRWALLEWKGFRLSGWPAAIIRKLADFMGYNDILPIGMALGVWRSQTVHEETCPLCARVD